MKDFKTGEVKVEETGDGHSVLYWAQDVASLGGIRAKLLKVAREFGSVLGGYYPIVIQVEKDGPFLTEGEYALILEAVLDRLYKLFDEEMRTHE